MKNLEYKRNRRKQSLPSVNLQRATVFSNVSDKPAKIIRSCRILGAVLALVVVHFLLFSLYSLSHEQSFLGETSLSVSRELLSSSLASFSTSINKISGSKKQKKKVVEPSLRKAPPSIPNPTQNK
ncbi:hypothetical protein JHK82_053637 [Glycine max]|nr:hypothetical protein JHK85_054432 [Glycine max]KAG5086240.1 hypothetical protein JHK82_053637 [Glycine max]